MWRRVLGWGCGFLLLGIAAAAPPSGQLLNTRLAVVAGPWGGGEWILFGMEESDRDLNVDRDTADVVLAAAPASRLEAIPLGVALGGAAVTASVQPPVAVCGRTAAVLVSEADQGGRDLNGDGDARDDVLHLIDLSTRQVRNVGLAAEEVYGGRTGFAAIALEARQGRDLTGDGDLADSALFWVDVERARATPIRPAGSGSGLDASGGLAIAEDRLLVATSEQAQGRSDLNGDGDAADVVAFLVPGPNAEATNLRLECATGFALTPQLAALAVAEAAQGGRDLNGDGDTADAVLFVYDLGRSEAINTQTDASGGVAAGGGYAVAICAEANQGGRDLNGDRDVEDAVAFVYTLARRQLQNTRLDAGDGAAVVGDAILLFCLEADQGNRDLNGDRDPDDSVAHLFYPATGRAFNTGLCYSGDEAIAIAGTRVAFTLLEVDQGERDLNGDRDTDDTVPVVVETALNAIGSRILPIACTDIVAAAQECFAFAVPEIDQFDRDLNQNGDTGDDVLHIFRWSR